MIMKFFSRIPTICKAIMAFTQWFLICITCISVTATLLTTKDEDIRNIPQKINFIKDTIQDFTYLKNLPGKKILLKGNHDYWWTTITKMRKFLLENQFTNIDFLFNNSYEFENKILCGTRGWGENEEDDNQKIINRELGRLELSLQNGLKKYEKGKEIIVFMHYPPITKSHIYQNKESEFLNLMKKYNIKRCYYGHLHGNSIKEAIEGNIEGIEFKLVSADRLDFKLIKL